MRWPSVSRLPTAAAASSARAATRPVRASSKASCGRCSTHPPSGGHGPRLRPDPGHPRRGRRGSSPSATAPCSGSRPARWSWRPAASAASTRRPRTRSGAIGDGLALAARAGRGAARHGVRAVPSDRARRPGRDPMPLVTEALRGEGARLIDEIGERFMAGITGGRARAARRRGARASSRRSQRGRTVYLDARGALGAALPTRFPTVSGLCRRPASIRRVQPIPVRPAAHYHMGGIAVDASGRARVPGLWACGEVASHGRARRQPAGQQFAAGSGSPTRAASPTTSTRRIAGRLATAEARRSRAVAALRHARHDGRDSVGVVRDAADSRRPSPAADAGRGGACDAALVAL